MTNEESAAQIYNLYPRKVGRRAALKSITFALTRLHDGEFNKTPMDWESAHKFLITKTRQYCDSPAGNRGMMTPHPATWFNQSRYLDHETEWYRRTQEEEQRARLRASEGMTHGDDFRVTITEPWRPQ